MRCDYMQKKTTKKNTDVKEADMLKLSDVINGTEGTVQNKSEKLFRYKLKTPDMV